MFHQKLINSVFAAYNLHTKFDWFDSCAMKLCSNSWVVIIGTKKKLVPIFAIVDILSDFGLDPLADHVFVHFSRESAPADCLKKPQPCRV